MDFGWITPLVSALGISIGGILGGLALLRRYNIPQSELMMWARSLWDWVVFTGQRDDVPPHIRNGAHEQLRLDRRGDDEDQGNGGQPRRDDRGGGAPRRSADRDPDPERVDSVDPG